MGLMQTLLDATLAARRARDEHAAFYASVLSDITAAAKADGNRQPTDEDADKVVRSTLKSLDKAMSDLPPAAPYAIQMKDRREKLAEFIPEPLTGAALERAIRVAADGNDIPIEMRSMGRIMAVLNQQHPGLIDGAAVSAAIKKGV